MLACHSLMLVLLNGGGTCTADCADGMCHSLMLVLLNGGAEQVDDRGGELGCHSLMLVLLNGGCPPPQSQRRGNRVPLADACVTEWRHSRSALRASSSLVPLADACVTEWRQIEGVVKRLTEGCHSLMLVLLNGGAISRAMSGSLLCATR